MTEPNEQTPEDADRQDSPTPQDAVGVPEDDRLLDEHAGPLVRPYVMTSGRTKPVRGTFDLLTLVASTGLPPSPELGLGPEHSAIVRLCEQVESVAEIAGHLQLPTITVRVLLGDLLDKGLVTVQEPHSEEDLAHDARIYEEVINGIRAL
jgi:hypothetical protein